MSQTKPHSLNSGRQGSDNRTPGYARDTKLRRVGGSLGVTLPREALNFLGYKEGQVLTVTFEGGAIQLRPSVS